MHGFASLHVVPSGAFGFEQTPVAGLQVPATWQASLAVHTTGLPARQTPARHESAAVQRLPSSHGEPSGLRGSVHRPVVGLHVPGLWQGPSTPQTTALPPTQIPAWQVSVWVHMLPSAHAVPLALGGFEHTPVAGLQVPAVWH